MDQTTPTAARFVPPDLEAAFEQWKASCGPCALAAILGLPMAQVRPFFPDFPKKDWCNIGHMAGALTAAGARWHNTPRLNGRPPWPARGLAFVQWGGFQKLHILQQYKYTHWIAIDGAYVFEINAPEANYWVPMQEWRMVMPRLIQDHEPKCDGTFFLRTSIEVAR